MEVNNMGLLDRVKKGTGPYYTGKIKGRPYYECSDCKCRLEKGEFIAIIGKAPPTGISVPMGRADVIFEKVGKIYCEEYFKKKYESK